MIRPDGPKIRIAAVLPSFAGGGAERVTLTLLGALDPGRFDRRLVIMDGSGPLRGAVPDDVALTVLDRPRLRQAVPALVSALRRLAPEVTFSSLGYVNLALAVARPLFGGRLILREANMPSLNLPRMPMPRVMPWAYRLLYPRADRVLATSARMATELSALGVPAGRLGVLHNPVDVARLRRLSASPRRAPGAGPRFVAAGRLVEQKGFDRLIPLLAQVPGSHLTLLGDGPQRPMLAELARSHGVAVDMPGFAADAPAWFAGADAVLLPSRWEGMPNVALEALACGTPVVATPESGGIAEVAAAALSGAVRVAEFGPAFAEAMGAVPVEPVERPRESLLPDAWSLEMVAAAFAALCKACAGGRQPALGVGSEP